MRREDSPQGQEEQEGGHEGCHRHAVAHVVDQEGNVVVQVVLLRLDRQTDTWADGGTGLRQGGAGALAVAPLCVLTLGAEVAPGWSAHLAPTEGSVFGEVPAPQRTVLGE